MPTRCIDCSTVSAIARMPVPRAATDGMRQSCCNRSVKVRACLSTYLSNFVKVNPCHPWLIGFKQNVSRLLLTPFEARTCQLFCKRLLKLFPHTRLLIARTLNVTIKERIKISGYGYRSSTLPFKGRLRPLRQRMHTSRIYVPRRRQAIARQPAPFISSVINAVKVIKIRFNHRAEAIQIEVRIAREHRIPRPLDQLSAFAQSALALRPLES